MFQPYRRPIGQFQLQPSLSDLQRTGPLLPIGRDAASLADGKTVLAFYKSLSVLLLSLCDSSAWSQTGNCETQLEVKQAWENIVLHEGSIAHLELNLVSPVYSVICAPCRLQAASLRERKTLSYLTKNSSDLRANGAIRDVYAHREEHRGMTYVRLRRWKTGRSEAIVFTFTLRAGWAPHHLPAYKTSGEHRW